MLPTNGPIDQYTRAHRSHPMTDVTFDLLSPTPATAGRALYRSPEQIPSGATQSTLFYVAYLGDGVTPPTPIDLTQCFDLSGPVGRGAFVFVDDAPQPGAPDQPDQTALDALWADLLAHLVVQANPPAYTRLA